MLVWVLVHQSRCLMIAAEIQARLAGVACIVLVDHDLEAPGTGSWRINREGSRVVCPLEGLLHVCYYAGHHGESANATWTSEYAVKVDAFNESCGTAS
jgi:hypothetical protein